MDARAVEAAAMLRALKAVQGSEAAGPYAGAIASLERALVTGRGLPEPAERGPMTPEARRAVLVAALEAVERLLEGDRDPRWVFKRAKLQLMLGSTERPE